MQRFYKPVILMVLVGLCLVGCAGPRIGSSAAARPSASAQPTHLPSIGKPLTVTAVPADKNAPDTTATVAVAQNADGLHTVALNDLPREVQQTIRLIEQGGPFPSPRDGSIFQNREGLLPQKPRGYYREYTIVISGMGDGGTRRIVAGESGELFYTTDRFVSFTQVIVSADVPTIPAQTSAAPTRVPTRGAPVATPKPANTLPQSVGGFRAVPLGNLPREAQQTVRLIQRGGPFPYSRDGVIFQNLERVLPQKPRGYYHEYTVVTPGASDRGARRIIKGETGELFYTADHYASFVRVIIP